jgi:hypothetical protein
MQDTAITNTPAQTKYNKPIIYFLLLWTALNILQASTLEVHADEAYYWIFSRMMDWGFYYHPPMVAVFIRIGDTLMHNELGTRLAMVLTSTLSIYIIWLMLKRYEVSAKWFILLMSGVWVFQIYGFTATPDAPLLFFTVLFYYFYQQYIDNNSWKLALILGIVVVCLMYSKYHGILVVSFTLLSNLKLLRRPSFYFIVLLAVGLYVPHILWQYHHNFPAINISLFEREGSGFHFNAGSEFFFGQLLLGGALTSWYLFYASFITRIQDKFMRALQVNMICTFAFFILSSLRASVQLHYALIGFVPLVMLALINLKERGLNPTWLYRLSITNIALFVAFRLCVVAGFDFLKGNEQLEAYFGHHKWADAIHAKIGDSYLIMKNEYQDPSRYSYYTNSLKGFAYDSRYYRTTQFDMWPFEEQFQHKRVYYLTHDKIPNVTTDSMTIRGKWYGSWVDDTRTYQKLKCKILSPNFTFAPGQQHVINMRITNPYPYAINFSNKGETHPLTLEACMFIGGDIVKVQASGDDFHNISLKPGEQTYYAFTLTAPEKKANYWLFFSWRTEPFQGSRNSDVISFTVK